MAAAHPYDQTNLRGIIISGLQYADFSGRPEPVAECDLWDKLTSVADTKWLSAVIVSTMFPEIGSVAKAKALMEAMESPPVLSFVAKNSGVCGHDLPMTESATSFREYVTAVGNDDRRNDMFLTWYKKLMFPCLTLALESTT